MPDLIVGYVSNPGLLVRENLKKYWCPEHVPPRYHKPRHAIKASFPEAKESCEECKRSLGAK